jgi:hypothetical protein
MAQSPQCIRAMTGGACLESEVKDFHRGLRLQYKASHPAEGYFLPIVALFRQAPNSKSASGSLARNAG